MSTRPPRIRWRSGFCLRDTGKQFPIISIMRYYTDRWASDRVARNSLVKAVSPSAGPDPRAAGQRLTTSGPLASDDFQFIVQSRYARPRATQIGRKEVMAIKRFQTGTRLSMAAAHGNTL